MQLASFSVRNYQFTIIVFVAALLLGLNALFTMPRGEDPPFGAPIFIVLGVYPGTSPNDMEELVVDPIEEELYNLSDVKKIVTRCDDGLMILQIEFNYGVDVDSKNNDVIREVNKLRPDLPDGLIKLDVTRAASSDVAILQTALVSETASWDSIRQSAERLESELERVRDLKWVRLQAQPETEVRIELDLPRMASLGLGLNQVLGAIQSNNINIPGGDIDLGARKFNIKTTSDYDNLDQIRNTVVKSTPQGNLVYLHNIATVRLADEEASHIARFNGQRAMWVISALKDRKNIVQTREQMEPILKEVEASLPANIKMHHAFDQNESVVRRLSGLGRDFAIAISLVLITLLPLGLRAASVVMISIPLSLSIGLFLLNILGYTLNQLSIVGMVIALGLLVDDSIVVVENIERYLRTGMPRKQAAIEATRQITMAVLGCTATLILAFLPLAFLPEGSGEFIRSLPMAVMLTVIASFFVALTIIPFLSSVMLKTHTAESAEGNWFFRAFKNYINNPYQKLLVWCMAHPFITLLLAFLIFGASLMLVPKLGFSVFPASEKPMLVVDIETPPGSSLRHTDVVSRKVERYLLQQPGVRSVSSNAGRGNPRVYYNEFQRENSANYAQLLVQLQPTTEVPGIVAFADTIRRAFSNYPGARIEVKQFQQGPPVIAPIEIRVVGEQLDTLERLAAEVEKVMKKTPGTLYVRNDLKLRKTDLQFTIDRDKAGLLGVPVAEIARTIRLGIAGLPVSEWHTPDGEEYTINVTVNADTENALRTFEQLYVTSLSGALVPLQQVAQSQLSESPSLIRHFNKERYTSVSSFAATGYNVSAVTDEILKSLESVRMPQGYRLVAAGERETQAESFGGMGTIVMLAMFGLLAILVLEFRTFKSTLIVLSVIPMGIIGAIAALYVAGETLSFVATVGIIALAGIEVKNSILLVDYTNQLREKGVPLMEAIMDGAETRFLPILLTSATAIGGMIPLVLEHSPLISPLAVVLIGGLISSTLLSRLVTPVLYKLLPPKVTVKTPVGG